MAAAPVLPASPAPPPAPAPLSQGARIIDTFIAPSKTFTDLRRSASWWAPWLLIAVCAALFAFAMGKQVGFEQISKSQVEHSKRADQFDKLPADQQAAQLRLTGKIVAFFILLQPVPDLALCPDRNARPVADLQVAFGGETTFGQAYAIIMYGWLPGLIGALLGVISLFAGVNPEGFDINNPVGTNVGYYLDAETTGKFVRAMASSLDVFTIWIDRSHRHRLRLHQQSEADPPPSSSSPCGIWCSS